MGLITGIYQLIILGNLHVTFNLSLLCEEHNSE